MPKKKFLNIAARALEESLQPSSPGTAVPAPSKAQAVAMGPTLTRQVHQDAKANARANLEDQFRQQQMQMNREAMQLNRQRFKEQKRATGVQERIAESSESRASEMHQQRITDMQAQADYFEKSRPFMLNKLTAETTIAEFEADHKGDEVCMMPDGSVAVAKPMEVPGALPLSLWISTKKLAAMEESLKLRKQEFEISVKRGDEAAAMAKREEMRRITKDQADLYNQGLIMAQRQFDLERGKILFDQQQLERTDLSLEEKIAGAIEYGMPKQSVLSLQAEQGTSLQSETDPLSVYRHYSSIVSGIAQLPEFENATMQDIADAAMAILQTEHQEPEVVTGATGERFTVRPGPEAADGTPQFWVNPTLGGR